MAEPIVVEQFVAIRYITAALYVCLLLEHLHTLPQEINAVWKAPLNIVRILFLIFRYATLAGMTLLTHSMSGLTGSLTNHVLSHSCRQAISGLSALAVLAMGIGDLVVVLRVSVLWNRARAILIILLGAFFLSYLTAVVCAGIGASYLVEKTMFFSNGIKFCVPVGKPNSLFGVWAAGVAFDLLVLIFVVLNTHAKSRKEQTAFTKALFKDSVIYFLILAGLRALNLFMTLFSPYYLVGVCISWPVSAIILSRFILCVRPERATASPPLQLTNNDGFEDDCHMEGEYLPPLASTRRHNEITHRDSAVEMWEIEEARSVRSHDKL